MVDVTSLESMSFEKEVGIHHPPKWPGLRIQAVEVAVIYWSNSMSVGLLSKVKEFGVVYWLMDDK